MFGISFSVFSNHQPITVAIPYQYTEIRVLSHCDGLFVHTSAKKRLYATSRVAQLNSVLIKSRSSKAYPSKISLGKLFLVTVSVTFLFL